MKNESRTAQDRLLLTTLPAELIDNVLSFLDSLDLVQTALVCRLLHSHVLKDTIWIPLIKANIPGATNFDHESVASYRHALTVLHPFVFLTRQKIWFSDSRYVGNLIICRYDTQTRAIVGNTLFADRGPKSFEFWKWAPDVIIHRFDPKVNLDLTTPVIHIDAASLRARSSASPKLGQPVRMAQRQVEPRVHMQSSFMLAKPWPHVMSPSSQMWPPAILPANERCRTDSLTNFSGSGHRPETLSQMSESTFRLHTSMQMSTFSGFPPVKDTVTAWATLPVEAYTPTKQKPWRGIWVGDYSGHGCEFLVVLQPDDPQPLPEGVLRGLAKRKDRRNETAPDTRLSATVFGGGEDRTSRGGTSSTSTESEDIYTGRLEAVKITGDINVQRGEYTFIAPDIGDEGLIRIATEELFEGARVLKSVGHIASHGYRDDEYITSQLILVSENRIAQYWEDFGHISYYQRVDIDEFISV
ncbi:hypothetical protein EJ05DRAFT_503420 [Pseudovirgaria hyperparasitica]|uniref:F-box domain-containing protein n=1 Tax=Pseudovirgaria hyperparasitica TaxID=470096 RepID=A0A6A6VZ03_9PEZI|nr:uncharacterized protein EJ05DRAFT_503420 [Pseudovirgaria hyperparasitica]KAF2755109.1 hypothetical protein EJ05DRAFT_503420 [Pseudovirgaria hyperparasitica]